MTQECAITPIIDTHMHLDEPKFDDDRATVIAAARAVGVRRFVNIGYKPERWHSSGALRDANADIDMAIGFHPQLAAQWDTALERSMRDAVEMLRPVAIGEIGFDFARSRPDFADQRRAFQAQLDLAEGVGLPVIIHQRAAASALMVELDRWPELAPIVLHSFDGDGRLTDWAKERRCYIGIGGLACKRTSFALRGLLRHMPLDRLLLETDAPYLAPPDAKTQRNSPTFLPMIAEQLAPIWDLTTEELCRQTTRNAERLLRHGSPCRRSD